MRSKVLCVAAGDSPGETLRHPPHGIKHPIRRIDPVKIFGHLGAQEAAGHRMRGVALNPRGTAIFHGDQDSAGVRTIVRTSGVHNLLHRGNDYNLGKTQVLSNLLGVGFVSRDKSAEESICGIGANIRYQWGFKRFVVQDHTGIKRNDAAASAILKVFLLYGRNNGNGELAKVF